MNKRFSDKDDEDIKRITFAGTIILVIFLILFFVVTAVSTSKLASQIKLTTEHPFAVNGDISDIKTNLALMRLRTERLQSYNQPEDVEKVRLALDDLYEDMEKLLNEVDDLYLGPDEDIKAMEDTYSEIQKAQNDLLEFAIKPSSTLNVIAQYEDCLLYTSIVACASKTIFIGYLAYRHICRA